MKDVLAMQVKKFSRTSELLNPPLVVLNNFGGQDRHLQLMTVALQNMFPAINVSTVKVRDCTRVVLFHRDPATDLISMRHFKIVLNPVGVSKSIKRVASHKVSSLGDFNDVSEYVLGQAKASESDLEDDSEAHVAVEQRVRGMVPADSQGRKAAIRLFEIGPRIEMKLSKIQAGFMQGEVMWHWRGLDYARLEEQKQKDEKRKAAFPGAAQVAKREKFEIELERKKEAEKLEAEQAEKRARQEKKEERKKRKLMMTGVKKKTTKK